MINGEHLSEQQQQQLADQFLNDGRSPTEFIAGELTQGVFPMGPSPIEGEFKESDVPADLSHIDTSDLIGFFENGVIGQPVLPKLIEKENEIPVRENMMVANSLPNLEEHDIAGMGFELNLNPSNNGKNNCFYSQQLRKVFIKLDKTCYIEVRYTSKNPNQQLNLRAMMVYVNHIISPVKRCQNHLFTDQSESEAAKHNVLRSENSNVTYHGTSQGQCVKDRLSVLIPLGFEYPDKNNQIKQSIALKFVCQNSCIGREPTAVIFTLETSCAEVLGKKIMHVKVCSCPKRDKANDEKKYASEKREGSDLDLHPDKKPAKRMKIKEEPGVAAPDSPAVPTACTPDLSFGSSEVLLTIRLPNAELARYITDIAFNTIAGCIARNSHQSDQYCKYLKEIKKTLDNFNNATKD